MAEQTVVQFGASTLTVSQLRLGQLKKVRAELAQILAMQKTAGDEALPTVEQMNAIATLVFVSANGADPSITRDAFDQIVDDLPFDTGLRDLTSAVRIVMARSDVTTVVVPGEAPSPAME